MNYAICTENSTTASPAAVQSDIAGMTDAELCSAWLNSCGDVAIACADEAAGRFFTTVDRAARLQKT